MPPSPAFLHHLIFQVVSAQWTIEIIGKMLGRAPWDGGPLIINPLYTPYIISWVYHISPFKGLHQGGSTASGPPSQDIPAFFSYEIWPFPTPNLPTASQPKVLRMSSRNGPGSFPSLEYNLQMLVVTKVAWKTWQTDLHEGGRYVSINQWALTKNGKKWYTVIQNGHGITQRMW